MVPSQTTLLTDRWGCGVCGVGSEEHREKEEAALRGAASGEKTYTDCGTHMVSKMALRLMLRFAEHATGETSTAPERVEVIRTLASVGREQGSYRELTGVRPDMILFCRVEYVMCL